MLALTGFATFVHEVVWTRVLAMVVGPSIFAFAATLTSFISGLALGSFVGASTRGTQSPHSDDARADVDRHGGGIVRESRHRRQPVVDIGPDDSGHTASLIGLPLPLLAIACGLTFPIALGIGVAFPLSLELAGSPTRIPARRLGILYAVNTVGAVLGALVAGFVAIPAVGLRASLLVATTALLLGAVAAILRSGLSNRGRVAAVVPVVAVVVWMATSPGWDREWLSAGGYLYSRFVPAGVDRRAALTAGRLVYYREGATATVSVKALTGERSLSIDGKVDASTGRDMLTQKVLAHLPLLLHPDPRRVAIVGLGSGVTLASALVHPVASVDVVEISPEVVEASAEFADVNRRALDDPAHAPRARRRPDASLADVPSLRRRDFRAVESVDGGRCRALHAGLLSAPCANGSSRAASSVSGRTPTTSATPICAPSSRRFAPYFPTARCGSPATVTCCSWDRTCRSTSRLDAISTTWQRPGVREDLGKRWHCESRLRSLSLFVGGPAEMSRYADWSRCPDRRSNGAGILRTVCRLCRRHVQSRRARFAHCSTRGAGRRRSNAR